MTTETLTEGSDDDSRGNQNATNDTTTVPALPQEIIEICEYLSCNTKIIFKSQQINDPELERWEKVEIAKEIYEKNRQTFLQRFGGFLDEQHLVCFERLVILENTVPLNKDEYIDEMQLLLEDYQQKLHTRRRDVKNRRYTALQQLIQQGEYFSEQEMMKRAPELYQELIGQYLSSAEKKQRDSYDVKNTTFSGILMHTMETRQLEDVLKVAEKNNKAKEPDFSEESHEESDNHTYNSQVKQPQSFVVNAVEDLDAEVPECYRQQWGSFDNVKVPCSISKVKPSTAQTEAISITTSDPPLITGGERDLLRQEFVRIMHEQFLEGKDIEFDYAQVDDNAELDDLQQINQDREDEYFEESDDEEIEDHNIKYDSTESEDDLDIYMTHLNNHHSLQK